MDKIEEYIIVMRKLKWTLILFSVISIISCSSDDDLQIKQLIGTWQQTYSDSDAIKEFVQYEFIPMSVDNYSRGICRKKTHDVNWGFVISQGKYVISDFDQSLYVFIETEDRHIDAKVFEIQKLSSKEMTLLLKDSGKILKFRK